MTKAIRHGIAFAEGACVERMRNSKKAVLASILSCLLGAAPALAALDPSAGLLSNCTSCSLPGMTGAQALQLENQLPSASAFAQFSQRLGLLPVGSPIRSSRPALPSEKDLASWVNYTGGELPNAFERPWSMSATRIDTYRWVLDQATQTQRREMTRFNPNFTTSFYDHNEGILWNSPSAPWNAVARAWNLPQGSFAIRTTTAPGSFESGFSYETPPQVPPALSVSLI
jgi:hypothetical protein